MNDNWRLETCLKNTFDDFKYVEWKYFSFTSKDISGFFCYSIGNPTNILGLRKGIISYAIYYGGKSKIGEFVVSGKRCDISKENEWFFDIFSIRKRKNGLWGIKGEGDGLVWNLTIKNIAYGGENIYDIDENRWMGWAVFSNLAHVDGRIKINDASFTVDGSGYYDSNYGNCKFSKTPWHWIRIEDVEGDTPIAFTFFELRDMGKVGNGYMTIDGITYSLNSPGYLLDVKYIDDLPRGYKFKYKDKKHDLTVNISMINNKRHLLKISLFKFVTMLKLHLIEGEYKMVIDLDGKRYLSRGTFRAEYPLKTFF